MRFGKWMKMRETALRKILDVPQSPIHHPEGSVQRHTYMVRQALNQAINMLKKQNGPFSNLNFDLTPDEKNIVRLAAWLHDIGKSKATQIDPETGKITAHKHEDPEFFEPAMQELGPIWKRMYEKTSEKDKEDLWFIIKNHMKLNDEKGFGRKILDRYLDEEGKYKNERKVKLLLVLLLMDRMGRGGTPDFDRLGAKEFVKQNIEPGEMGLQGLKTASKAMQQKIARGKENQPAPDDPVDFVQHLKDKPKNVIQNALKGKFPGISDEEISRLLGEGFKCFLEAAEVEAYDSIKPQEFGDTGLPLPPEDQQKVDFLHALFKDRGYSLFVVGGIVRDYLFNKFHPDLPYSPKDVDLATEAKPKEVEKILKSPEAQYVGLKALPLGEAFGIWMAHFPDGTEYEIATFREEEYDDPDSRKPTKVSYTTPGKDAERRDLTMNALFYDLDSQEIRDYNVNKEGRGQGFEDIQNRTANPGQDPNKRFQEDRLRVLRLIRFFSKYNPGEIKQSLTPETIKAIDKFRHLPGISGERIANEFISGLLKSVNTLSYLKNYEEFSLFSSIFPGLVVNTEGLNHIGNSKSVPAVIAWLLSKNRDTKQLDKSLKTKLKYPGSIAEPVVYLIKLSNWIQNGMPDREFAQLLKQRNMINPNDVMEFAQMASINPNIIRILMNYQPQVRGKEELFARFPDLKGVTGEQLGQAIRQKELELFRQQLESI